MQIGQPSYPGAMDYIMDRAFKFKGLNSLLEAELGRRMLTHEISIDRSYLDARLNSAAFPNRTGPSLAIIQWVYDTPEGYTITSAELSRTFNCCTVHNVIRKLVACRGIELVSKQSNGRCLYKCGPENRDILWGILDND